MKLFLHIGSGKTGSTSIQHVLSANAQKMLDYDLYYPDVDRQNQREIHNHNILSLPSTEVIPREYYRRLGKNIQPALRISRKKWGRLGDLVAETNPKNIILSSEYLFYARKPERITQLIRKHMPKVTQIEIICYLRDPIGFYVSNLQQTIKASGNIPLPTPPAYFDALKRWDKIGKLSVRQFSKASFVESDLITDFIYRLNAKIPVKKLVIPAPRNETFSAEGMSILQEFRKHIYPSDDNVFMPSSNLLLKNIRLIENKFGNFDFFSRPTLRQEAELYIRGQSNDAQLVLQHYGLDFGCNNNYFNPNRNILSKFDNISDIIHINEFKKTVLYHNLLALMIVKK